MTPGIHRMTSEQYHADPAPVASLSSSIAQIMINQSPAHAWLQHPRLNPAFKPETNSRFDLGSAAHAMLLEGDNSKIVVVDADDWRTKAAKEARDTATAMGKYAVLEKDYAEVMKMVFAAKCFLKDSELGDLLETGLAEQTVLWEENGVWCRARPDLLDGEGDIVLDYKTTSDASPENVAKQIGRMGYDLQAEFYLRGVNAVTALVPTFVFLFQEIEPPYACSLASLSASYQAVGRSKVNRAMHLWQTCTTTNNWPGYSNQVAFVEPKPWDLAQAEELSV